MDTAQRPQEIGVDKSMGETAANSCSRPLIEKKVRPQINQALNCPRCRSTNTKFSYYNNYSLTQPRYFCKACRRYWTEGGTLRNVPVGGGSKRNKKSSLSMSSHNKLPDLNPPVISLFSSHPVPHKISLGGQDLNLAFPAATPPHFYPPGVPHFFELSKIEKSNSSNSFTEFLSNPASPLDLLSTGTASKGLNAIVPTVTNVETNALLVSSFPFQECKPAIGIALDGRPTFPFVEIKRHSGQVNNNQMNKESSNGYWNGVLGGGSW